MRESRRSAFDSRRNLLQNGMAEQQDIQSLQLAIQQLQEQYQREIATLRQQIAQPGQQQIAQPGQMFQLTADQILNKFQHIRTFYGKEDFSLQEFISAVENVGILCGNNEALLQHGLQMVFKEKIQGDAKRCIQRLGGDVTWEQVKAELKTQFRPRKSYKKLMDESRCIKVGNLRELFFKIRAINFELNELYEYDDNKPTNYSPENNDKNLVDIVKDMLTGSYRINIRSNMTLNEVFNIFDDLGLLDESDVIHYNYRRNSKAPRHDNTDHRNFKRNNHDRQVNDFRRDNFRDNYDRNFTQKQSAPGNFSGQFRRNEYFRQDRNFYNNNRSEQYRQNFDQQRTFHNGQNNRSGQFRQGRNNNFNNNPNNVTPMEIDNLQCNEINFSTPPQEEDCP